MLDFRLKSKPKSYVTGRDRRWVLLSVFLLGLLLLAVRWSLEWSAAASASVPLDAHLDNRVRPVPEQAEAPDVFVSSGISRGNRSRKYFPGVKPEYLQAVRDDTVFRGSEHKAWFHLLDVLSRAEAQALRASTGEVSFVQLHEQPAAYRGELVTV